MVKSKVIETIVEIITVMLIFVPASIVGTKIDGKIDLVIIAPCNMAKRYIDAFKDSIKSLPDHIEMGEDKVRVAVVEPAHGGKSSIPGARILFDMSSDKAALQKWVTEWNAATWGADNYWHSEAFKLVRTQVFDFETTNRGKMVIQVLNGWPFDQDRENAYEEARRLRAKGAIIYVSYDPKAPHLNQDERHRQDAEAYVGKEFKWRMVGNERGDHLQMFKHAMDDILKLGNEITRDLCTICSFMEPQTKCTPAVRPVGSKIDNFGDNNARCQSVTKADLKCPVVECEDECNRHWPWDVEWPCSIPCVHLLHHRISKDPPPGMENCPTERRCNLTCTTTTTVLPTTTEPSTTGPSTTEASISVTGPSETGSSETGPSETGSSATGPSETGPSETGPFGTWPTKTGPSGTELTTMTTNGTSGDPGAIGPGGSGSGGMSSSTNLALIIVGVIIALLVIVGIIIVAVVVSKRKAKKKAQDEKRKKAEADLKRKQSMSDKSKRQGDEAISMRSSSGKTADESMGVSLAMTTIKPSKKSAAKSMASKKSDAKSMASKKPGAKSMASKKSGATPSKKAAAKSVPLPSKKAVGKSEKSSSVSKGGSKGSKKPMQKK